MIGSRYEDAGTRTPTMTDRIWTWRYKCRIPVFHSRTVEDVRRNGVIVTGDKKLDQDLKDDWLSRYMTINDMIEFFKRDVPVRVINVKDTKDIYDTIQTHLMQWLENIRVGMNVRDAPIDDLLNMDRFAALVYPYAKHFFTPETLQSELARSMSDVQRVNMTNFFSNINGLSALSTTVNPNSGVSEPIKHEDRRSFKEGFKASMNNNTFREY